MRKELYICDVCKNEENRVVVHDCTLTVVFTTEQNEGRAVMPYIDTVTLDVCEKCREKMIAGNMLFAHGAMGYNDYYFKEASSTAI